jgi:succinate dehydrogenase / fumarate reductase flavoprotein subunit
LLFAKGASWPVSCEEKSHIIDIAVFKEINSGRKVYLDYNKNPEGLNKTFGQEKPITRLKKVNPELISWFEKHGINLEDEEMVEIAPAIQHFQGGVKIRERGQTTVKGLYAVGECAGGQHGANRPGGNSLLDGQVFGKIAGYNAVQEVKELKGHQEVTETQIKSATEHIRNLMNKDGLREKDAKERIQEILSKDASVVRTYEGLSKNKLEEIKVKGFCVDKNGLAYCIETVNILDVALMVMTSARIRTESRGPHLFFQSYDDITPIPRDYEGWKKYIVVKRENNRMKYEVSVPMKGK